MFKPCILRKKIFKSTITKANFYSPFLRLLKFHRLLNTLSLLSTLLSPQHWQYKFITFLPCISHLIQFRTTVYVFVVTNFHANTETVMKWPHRQFKRFICGPLPKESDHNNGSLINIDANDCYNARSTVIKWLCKKIQQCSFTNTTYRATVNPFLFATGL